MWLTLGVTGTDRDSCGYVFMTNLHDKTTQGVGPTSWLDGQTVEPVSATVGQFYITFPQFLPITGGFWYLSRRLTSSRAGIVGVIGTGFSGNGIVTGAPWIYEGGVLSDPGKTVMLSLVSVDPSQQPSGWNTACFQYPVSPNLFLFPVLLPYSRTACRSPINRWVFNPAPSGFMANPFKKIGTWLRKR
jgi:hypothetical protein